jgi:hypothetical protein
MKIYPQFPEDWHDAEQTLYRNFYFESLPDVECLIRLVKENIGDRGNDGVLRARLLGILHSYHSRINAKFWERHEHPKTYMIRLLWRNVRQWFHRTFKTKDFRNGVLLSNLAYEVATEISEKYNV